MPGYQKISVNLSDEVLGAARALAETHHVSLTEVLRRAISTQVFLEEAQQDGKDILLRVNGQFDVPAGGQVKVPTLCGMF